MPFLQRIHCTCSPERILLNKSELRKASISAFLPSMFGINIKAVKPLCNIIVLYYDVCSFVSKCQLDDFEIVRLE